MKRYIAWATICIGGLFGCASQVPQQPHLGIDTITLEYQPPFCFTCTRFVATLEPDGAVRIVESQRTANVRGERSSRRVTRISADQVEALHSGLSPYKPTTLFRAGPSGEECEHYISDDAAMVVTWDDGNGNVVSRVFDFGCKDDPAMNAAVQGIPQLLGLQLD